MKCRLPLYVVALVAGCSDLPMDPEGTLDRIRTERQVKIGVAPGTAAPLDQLVRRIESTTGARVVVEAGATEPLLERLERGELDLVTGAFAAKSPWAKQVSFLPAMAEQVKGSDHVLLTAAARNGENAWIGLLHREALAVRAGR